MNKLALGICLLLLSGGIFFFGGLVCLASVGSSSGGGTVPNDTGVLIGAAFMLGSIIVFLIGLVRTIQGISGKKIKSKDNFRLRSE